MKKKIDKPIELELAKYDNSWYSPGGSGMSRAFWYAINHFVFRGYCFPFSRLKIALLTIFGSKVGVNITIKPRVNIKYPWRLKIGDHSWIGEEVWIDNLADVEIGKNVCISQGAMLLTGNHNYKSSSFDLMIAPITLEDGCWIGAKAIVCPGVKVGTHAVLLAGSVATSDLEPYGIYQGNPAALVKRRVIESTVDSMDEVRSQRL